MSTAANAGSIKLPKFLVTTVEPKSQDGDKVVYNKHSTQLDKLPLFLVDVKYEDKASVAAEWKQDTEKTKDTEGTTKYKQFVDAGKGDFSGTAVSQARGSEFTVALTLTLIAIALTPAPTVALAPALAPAPSLATHILLVALDHVALTLTSGTTPHVRSP